VVGEGQARLWSRVVSCDSFPISPLAKLAHCCNEARVQQRGACATCRQASPWLQLALLVGLQQTEITPHGRDHQIAGEASYATAPPEVLCIMMCGGQGL